VAQWILWGGRYGLFGFPTILIGFGSVFRFKYALWIYCFIVNHELSLCVALARSVQ
jgi:hypothetical protein